MKTSTRSVRTLIVCLLTALSSAGGLHAQTYQGTLRGAVRDAQGVIPGAEVTLTNEETNATRSAMTNESGEYVFASVLPGAYTVRVALPGFRTAERRDFRIGTQQSAVLDFVLEIGGISEQITVVGEAPLVERASATQSASLDKEALQNLPIFGRNTFFAAISTPGVIQSGDPQFVRYQDQSGSSLLSLGGGPRRGNGYLLDGVPITDFTNRPTIAPSMEAVEELKVQTKTYEADMGHAAGGVFNTTARSGTNTWHGGALLVTKPGATTGTLFFAKRAGLENPPQYYYNWAGSLGGPIRKDRTFFWFSTDDYVQRSTRNNVLTLPTALERAGDFSQSRTATGQLITIYDPLTTRTENGAIVRDPFPGNVIPADRLNPIARAMLAAMPMPTSGRSFNGQATLDDGPQHQETLKVDQRWTDRWTTSGLYAHQYTKEPGSAFYGAFGSVPGDPGASMLYRTVDFLALNNIFVPDANTAIASRYGFNRFKDFGGNYPDFDAASLGLPASLVNAMTFNTFPNVSITGYNGLGNNGPTRATHRTHAANLSLTRLTGRHTLKAGGEYRRLGAEVMAFSASAGSFSFTQAFTAPTPTASGGDAFASFLLGYPSSGSIVYATPAEYLLDYYAAFVQDEFRATPTLTLNYGLRYEYEPGVREAGNRFAVGFDQDAPFPVQVPGMTLTGGLMYAGVNGNPTTQGKALNGVAPRGGFAWSLSDRDVIRGGYGFYWAPMQFAGIGETAMARLGYSATTTYLASSDGNRSRAEAEDILQEAYLRWHQTDHSTVDNAEAWLVTIATRLAIDRLRKLKTEREAYVGPWLPEPIVGAVPPPDHDIDLAADLSMAFLTLLERLAPDERAAFLLHEVFDVGYSQIAQVLGRSEAACRQIVHRARERVRGERKRFEATDAARRSLLEKFMTALEARDEKTLLSLFAPDATWTADGGGRVAAAPYPVIGAERIVKLIIGLREKFWSDTRAMDIITVNGEPGLWVHDAGRPVAAMSVESDGERILNVYAVVNPDKLSRVAR